MPTPVAQWIVAILTLYAAIGVFFALIFVTRGVQRVDPGADKAPFFFRVLILPGAAALWPLMLIRWVGNESAPSDEPAS